MRSLLLGSVLVGLSFFAAPTSAGPIAPVAHGYGLEASLIQEVRRGGGVARGPRGGVAARGRYGGAAYRGPRGGVAVRGPYGRGAVRGPYGAAAVRGGAVVRPGYGAAVWRRPAGYWWRPGGAIAAGAAIGVVSAATAAAWAGAPPASGQCWYYTDPSRRTGFWDYCR